jgi:ACS family phthalate transporter-like MFS transporter
MAMLCIARSSDLKLERRWHFMLPTIVAAIGAVTLSQLTHNWLIATLCLSLIAIGFFAAAAIIWTIPPTYLKGDAAAGGMAVISSMGMIAGFVAPILIGWIENMTGSFSAGILLVAVLVLASGITVFLGVPPSASAGSGHA